MPNASNPSPNLNRWLTWQYRDNNNCWDFVCAVLKQEFNVPASALPKFGICPNNKREMTRAYHSVKAAFVPTHQPQEGAIACHFIGNTLHHVGVVMGGKIWHASSKAGTRKDSISAFTRIAKTGFYQWQH
jgi:hypothetical protein